VTATWSRPTPDRNEQWVKPSYIPAPNQAPVIQPREEPRPLYSPAPEFKPAENPDKQKEMPEAPKMPGERSVCSRRAPVYVVRWAVVSVQAKHTADQTHTQPTNTNQPRPTPERRPDPIPAGNPKEKPSEGGGEERREAPPAPDKK
jgi:hypothetical protein